MMTRLSLVRAGDGYIIRPTGRQRSLLGSVLLFMRDRREPDRALFTWVGCERARLTEFHEQIKSGDEVPFSIKDLHVIHAALLSVCNLFSSEEDFYIKIGFFRENVVALANGLIKAVGDAEAGP